MIEILKNKVDILFTFKRINENRFDNLIYTIKYYKQFIPNSNIIIAEQNTTTDFSFISNLVNKHLIIHTEEALFCRGFLFNEAYNISTCKYIILADADCLPHKDLLINFESMQEELNDKYLVAHKTMYYLTKAQTDLLINHGNFNPQTNIELLEKSHEYVHVGGVGFISSDQYYKNNGFKNSFVGWGGEDDDFYNRRILSKLGVGRLEYPALHLYHESSAAHGYNEQELQDKRDRMPPVRLVKHEIFE
jgi:predicted glycosyltransferase involved in capsule biosynthesis